MEDYKQEKYHFFVDLEHPYFLTASSRLTLYADKNRWAIVFEKSGYANRGFRGEIEFAYFGNCLRNLQDEGDVLGSTSNLKTAVLIDNAEIERIQGDSFELVQKNIKTVKVRDTMLTIEHDAGKYAARNIAIDTSGNPLKLIDIPSLIRYLSEEHPQLFRATDKELRQCLPRDLPMLMHINQWHQDAYYKGRHYISQYQFEDETSGAKPSSYETYRMIADILVSKDTSKWKPTLKPNNDWRNWPKAGYM